MIFDTPISFEEAMASRKAKALMPTNMTSEQLMQLNASIRERAMFSARVLNAQFLDSIDAVVERVINPSVGMREGDHQVTEGVDAREELRDVLRSIRYKSPTGKEGGIEDLSSNQRLDLIVRMNAEMAQSYGQWKQGQTENVLVLYPCMELKRIGIREVPRGTSEGYPDFYWQTRWQEAGGTLYDGERMVCRKDDPIASEVSEFGLPYGPPGFNSGYDWEDVDRDEAVALGVIEADEIVPPQKRDFESDVQGSVEGMSPALQDELLSELGSGYAVRDDIVRPESWTGGDGRVMDYGGNAVVAVNEPQPQFHRDRWSQMLDAIKSLPSILASMVKKSRRASPPPPQPSPKKREIQCTTVVKPDGSKTFVFTEE